MLKYARIDSITRRLSGRITVVDIVDQGITGVTETRIGTDLIRIIGEEQEEFIDMYLSMIYELPLQLEHPFLSAIVEKLVISEIYLTYFPTQIESPESTDAFATVVRQQALNNFQCLFNGLGIFIPGASDSTSQIQNDENRQQLSNRAVILIGEKIKDFIGYDYDGDNIADTDLYKLNSNVQPSFYTTGEFDKLESGQSVINNIRVRPRDYRGEDAVDVNFW